MNTHAQRYKTVDQRFWEKVNKNGHTPKHWPELGRCWEWIGSRTKEGYGHFWDGSRLGKAHHYLIGGRPPDGLMACHHCDNPRCVRPSHIFIGTFQDNMDDCISKGRNVVNRGEDVGGCKLSTQQAMMVRACPRKPGALRVMYDKLRISRSLATKIRAGAIWKHLPSPSIEDFERANDFVLKDLSKKGLYRGVNHPGAKLTEETAMLIRSCPSWSGAPTLMGIKLNLPSSTISRIKNQTSWKHLPVPSERDIRDAEKFLMDK